MTIEIAAVEELIIPGRPVKRAATIPTTTAVCKLKIGLTPATKAKATASGMSARATVRPDKNSARKFILLNPFIILVIKKLRSEEHTSELQSRGHLVCHLLLEKKTDPSEDTDFRPDQFNELLHLAGVVYSQLQDSRPLRILYGCAAHNGGEPRQRIQVAGRIAR